jgi:hypothetical protein
MATERATYQAYLLRLWLADAEAPEACWRASLEDPRSGERLGFATLEQMFAYLLAMTEGRTNGEDAETDSAPKG